MSNAKVAERRIKEIEELAKGWGKLLARDMFPGGPGLDVCLTDMEDIALAASKALIGGALGRNDSTSGREAG